MLQTDSKLLLHRACEVLAGWLRGPVALDPGLDEDGWKAVVTAARVHGVGPRLASLLQGSAWVPPGVADWIQAEAKLNRKRIDLLREEGAEILSMAVSRGVDVLPLKGLALAAISPRHIEQRPMADLDLLVRPSHAAALHEIVVELGYGRMVSKAKHDEYLPPTGRQVVSREHEHPDNPRPVEIHLRCGETFARTRFDLTDETWSSAHTAAIGEIEVPAPGVEAVWAHLLLHTAWQWWFGGGRMVQLLDLLELLPLIHEPATVIGDADPRIALLALGPADRLLPGLLPTGLIEDLELRAGGSAARLAAGLDPVGSSHLSTSGRSRLIRILQLHLGRPRDLTRAAGYILAPNIDEMLINHDRVPQGPARALAYPGLWLWHVANITGRG